MEILSTVNNGGEGGALFFGCIMAALALLLFTCSIYCFRDREYGFVVFSATIGVALSLMSIAAIADYATPDPAKYEVLITDMSKFDVSKYEIIEQRGKLFVIREINQ